jgi:hypothetical protein
MRCYLSAACTSALAAPRRITDLPAIWRSEIAPHFGQQRSRISRPEGRQNHHHLHQKKRI